MAYDQAKADEICRLIAEGEPLRQICRREDMPSKSEVYRWLDDDAAFAGRFACARAKGYDALAEETLDIADNAANDYMDRTRLDGSIDKVLDAEHIQRSKLRIETRLKLLAKWDPKRYGDKLALTDPDGGILKVESITRRVVDPKTNAS